MEKGRRDTVLLTVIAIATLLVAIVGATFAYFTATISGTNRGSTVTIQASRGGSMTFYGATLSVSNIYPSDTAWLVKPFRVDYENSNANYDVTYELKLVYDNTFGNNELTYTLAHADYYCTSNGTAATQEECSNPSTNWVRADNTGAVSVTGHVNAPLSQTTTGNITLGTGTFAATNPVGGLKEQTHAYTVTIKYPNDTSRNQNAAGQGKTFTAYIMAEEVSNRTSTSNNG